MKTLQIYESWGVKYTSKLNLVEAAIAGEIEMKKEIGEFGSWYTFFKNAKQIARFYQDHSFGFCTQPYGIQLSNI